MYHFPSFPRGHAREAMVDVAQVDTEEELDAVLNHPVIRSTFEKYCNTWAIYHLGDVVYDNLSEDQVIMVVVTNLPQQPNVNFDKIFEFPRKIISDNKLELCKCIHHVMCHFRQGFEEWKVLAELPWNEGAAIVFNIFSHLIDLWWLRLNARRGSPREERAFRAFRRAYSEVCYSSGSEDETF